MKLKCIENYYIIDERKMSEYLNQSYEIGLKIEKDEKYNIPNWDENIFQEILNKRIDVGVEFFILEIPTDKTHILSRPIDKQYDEYFKEVLSKETQFVYIDYCEVDNFFDTSCLKRKYKINKLLTNGLGLASFQGL
jgi:hypothetical protein